MKTIKIEVYGRVQGVYFRANTCQKAIEFDIKGNVKNRHDGSVEIIAEGEERNLDEFLNWCYKGPALAKVTSVVVTSLLPQGFRDFITTK